MKKEDIENEIRSFIEAYNTADDLTQFIEKCMEFGFIKPVVISMTKMFERTLPQEMSKELVFWLIALTLKLDDGDICIRCDRQALKALFVEKLLSSDMNAEIVCQTDEFEEQSLESLIDDFIEKITADVAQLVNRAPDIMSDDVSKDCPLLAYRLNTEESRIYFRSYYEYERNVASFIRKKSIYRGDEAYDLAYLKDALDILFPDEESGTNWQKIAAGLSAISDFSVISGGPGTGKTTTVVKVLALLLAKSSTASKRVMLCAPTGKAAARMIGSIENQLRGNGNFTEAARRLCEHMNIEYDALEAALPKMATTVHKALKIIPHRETPLYNEHNHLPCDILIVDEVSMISLSLFSKLIKALGPETKVILLGDKDQLFSVEPGTVFSDLCSCLNHDKAISQDKLDALSEITGYSKDELSVKGVCTKYNVAQYVSMLVKSRRFSSDSKLGKLSRAVNTITSEHRDQIKNWYGEDGYIGITLNESQLFLPDNEVSALFIEDSSQSSLNRISKSVAKATLDFYGGENEYISYLASKNFVIVSDEAALKAFELMDRYRVLCANREGTLGAGAINSKISSMFQSVLKKTSLKKEYNPEEFFPGKIILVTKNDSMLNVDNGDVGFVAYDSNDAAGEGRLKVFFPPKEGSDSSSDSQSSCVRVISTQRLSEYETGFAMTIHKSQGSEYENVCLVLGAAINPVMSKELIYTGLTRAKSNRRADNSVSGGRVSIISDKRTFEESVLRYVHRESGLACMLLTE
ncbi:MAG: exodeoxyribonuclease V subunit alpha [Succinivibrio sp.]